MSNMTDYEIFNEHLRYEPDTGKLFWRVDVRHLVKAGDETGCPNNDGHLKTTLKNRQCYVHRIAWLLTYGEWPEREVDHKNGIKADNRIANLRLATRRQNQCNLGSICTNTSGHKGVYFQKRPKKWCAMIRHSGRKHYLGLFKDLKDAGEAYRRAAFKYHGEFSSVWRDMNEDEREAAGAQLTCQ